MKNRKSSSTCLAALKNKRGKIYMAADRRVSWDDGQYQSLPHAKLNKEGGIIQSATGEMVLCTLIVHRFPKSKYYVHPGEVEPHDYIYDWYVPRLAAFLIHQGFKGMDNTLSLPRNSDATVLVAVKGKLFEVDVTNPCMDPMEKTLDGLVSAHELALPYATGCGGHLAWGSLLTTEALDVTVTERLRLALHAASRVSNGCDDKMDIENE